MKTVIERISEGVNQGVSVACAVKASEVVMRCV